MKYTLTNESITVVVNGKSHTVQKGSPQFASLREALVKENWDAVPGHLTPAKSISTWAKGKFTVDENTEVFSYNGEVLPSDVNQRIIEMATKNEDPTPLFRFWERLQKNPSKRSVDQLYAFLKHKKIPLTEDGCFLAYKSVKSDYKDHHSGTFDNKPGVVNEMPRNKISDDPREACMEGFHVGALSYASTFKGSPRMVICKVDPADVVCVPYDSNQEKIRVSRYEVIGHHGDELPSTVYKNEPPPSVVDDEDEETDTDEDEEDVDEPEDHAEAMGWEHESSTKKEEAEEESKEDELLETAGKVRIPKKYKKFVSMNAEKLMEQDVMTLREFATYGLSIVGASKIRGGKTALVQRIIEVRG